MENQDVKKDVNEDKRQAFLQKEQYNQQNPIFKDVNEEIPSSSSIMDHYEDDEHQNYLHQGAASQNNYAYVSKPNDLDNHEVLEQNSNYLMGGMISWMKPDGTSLKDDEVPYTLPKDDDMHDMTMGQKRMPTLHELLDAMTMDEKPKIIMEFPSTQTTSDKSIEQSRTLKTLYGNYKIY
jgi:hypothetical protein